MVDTIFAAAVAVNGVYMQILVLVLLGICVYVYEREGERGWDYGSKFLIAMMAGISLYTTFVLFGIMPHPGVVIVYSVLLGSALINYYIAMLRYILVGIVRGITGQSTAAAADRKALFYAVPCGCVGLVLGYIVKHSFEGPGKIAVAGFLSACGLLAVSSLLPRIVMRFITRIITSNK